MNFFNFEGGKKIRENRLTIRPVGESIKSALYIKVCDPLQKTEIAPPLDTSHPQAVT